MKKFILLGLMASVFGSISGCCWAWGCHGGRDSHNGGGGYHDNGGDHGDQHDR